MKALVPALVLSALSFSVLAQDATVSSELLKRGEYLARAGDCVACHTNGKSGVPFAGGSAMETPIGTIYSTNITRTKPPALAITVLKISTMRYAKASPRTAAPCTRRCLILRLRW